MDRTSPSAALRRPPVHELRTEIWHVVEDLPVFLTSERTAFGVHSFRVDEWLLWSKPDSTWAWSLTPTVTGGTRLVARIRAWYDRRHPLAGLTAVLLMEFGDFAMLRRMLRGIKARAESRD
jgi:hypothetical protein